MDLTRLPRRIYTDGPTSMEYLKNLTEYLEGPEIYIKRDDRLGLTEGGNKTRKLEFLVGDALQKGSDTLITCGAIQSNHCRLTLSAARKEQLDCHLVLKEHQTDSYRKDANGNNFLYNLLGAEGINVVAADADMEAEMAKIAEQLRADGKKPYVIPGGGSNEVGAAGYVICAQEILMQLSERSIEMDGIVTPTGSLGTHAGLAVGMRAGGNPKPIIGISVNKNKDEQVEHVYQLMQKNADYLDIEVNWDRSDVNVFDDYIGPGYAIPTEKGIEAIEILAQKEGILLDPVYTGKTMAGLIDLIRSGYFTPDEKILFLHTGGAPGLYAHTHLFQ